LRNRLVGMLIALLTLLTVTLFPVQAENSLEARVNVKVVFVGIPRDNIDLDYLRLLLVNNLTLEALVTDEDIGITGRISYTFVFMNDTFKGKLIEYLKSIEKVERVPNPWFAYYIITGGKIILSYRTTTNYIYDALKLEEWLIAHEKDYGGIPEYGYVLVVMYLPELPSLTLEELKLFYKKPAGEETIDLHYFGIEAKDIDRGYVLRYRGYMIGWGGRYRLWFIDLSAGPSFEARYDLPLQVNLEDQGIDLNTPKGITWLTEYVADYINEFVLNLVMPHYVYIPRWSRKYKIVVNIIDCRTEEERRVVPIETTVSPVMIEKAIRDLVPYSEVEVVVKFYNLTDLPGLRKVIDDSRYEIESWIYANLLLYREKIVYVDAAKVYLYLVENINLFLEEYRRDEELYVIPVFAFAFSKEYFAFKYKWLILDRHPEINMIWGAALEDIVLIGMNQKDFLWGEYVSPRQEGKGFGFTHTIIHELGHMFGLMHPHTFGDIGSFVSSVMSYYTYSYEFSIFDKDALARAHSGLNLLYVMNRLNRLKEESMHRYNVSRVVKKLELMEQTVDRALLNYSRLRYNQVLETSIDVKSELKPIERFIYQMPLLAEVLERELNTTRQELELRTREAEELRAQLEVANATIASLRDEARTLKDELTALRSRYEQLSKYFFWVSASLAMTAIALVALSISIAALSRRTSKTS